jgi:alcohol dehydrogenase class IV
MRIIQLQHPKRTVFGPGCLSELAADRLAGDADRILLLLATPLYNASMPTVDAFRAAGKLVDLYEYNFPGEPTFRQMDELLAYTREFEPDCVIGIGGGSVLDCAKLMAALGDGRQALRDVAGINILKGRYIGLICVPTTSGTGSEMSPNAILLDETTNEKKGIISPDLVPDAVYIDPALTLTLPTKLTAETGIDALTHCIEAYTNKFAHSSVDLYALEGIRLIGASLLKACQNGADLEARRALSLGSMYGGLCLGPVNTAAVHALSYGLGGKHHISHGLANAILLPDVLLFNLPACVERTADIAHALGVPAGMDAETTALAGIERIRELCIACGIPQHLSQIGIRAEDLPELVAIAMNVKRLLANNPRDVQESDALCIFTNLL